MTVVFCQWCVTSAIAICVLHLHPEPDSSHLGTDSKFSGESSVILAAVLFFLLLKETPFVPLAVGSFSIKAPLAQ